MGILYKLQMLFILTSPIPNTAFKPALSELYDKHSVCTKIRLFKIQNRKFWGTPLHPTPSAPLALELRVLGVLFLAKIPAVSRLSVVYKLQQRCFTSKKISVSLIVLFCGNNFSFSSSSVLASQLLLILIQFQFANNFILRTGTVLVLLTQ